MYINAQCTHTYHRLPIGPANKFSWENQVFAPPPTVFATRRPRPPDRQNVRLLLPASNCLSLLKQTVRTMSALQSTVQEANLILTTPTMAWAG